MSSPGLGQAGGTHSSGTPDFGSAGSTGTGTSASGGTSGRTDFGGASGAASGNRLGGGGGLTDTLQELQGRADQLMDQAADQLDEVAGRIDGLAERVPNKGLGVKAQGLASGAADTLESVARFLRDNDVDTLQRDLGRIASQHPLQSLLAAVGAGFIVGKLLR
jgi:hypothetical protein